MTRSRDSRDATSLEVEDRRPRQAIAFVGRAVLVIAGLAAWGWGAVGIVSGGVTLATGAACVVGVIAALVGIVGPRATFDALFDILGGAQ